MIWTNDYETVRQAAECKNEKVRENLIKAYTHARNMWWNSTEDDFIVIKVESYSCIALVKSEWSPIEIADTVFPFDEKQVYPMQGIEQKITFRMGY